MSTFTLCSFSAAARAITSHLTLLTSAASKLLCAEDAQEDAHDVGLWDEDNDQEDETDEDEDPVFEFDALVAVVEAERPKQISRWLALRL
eukprot:6455584-Amphidinium_carterae.3